MTAILKTIKAKHLFALYLIALVNFVIIKFFGDLQEVLHRIEHVKAQKVEGYSSLQLVPFRTINSSMNSFLRWNRPSCINRFSRQYHLICPNGFFGSVRFAKTVVS